MQEAAKAVQAFALLREGATLEIFSLDVGKVLGIARVAASSPEPPAPLDRVILDAAAVSQKYNVELRIPKKIEKDDVLAIAMLLAIADGSPLTVTGFRSKLVKTKEHEGNVTGTTMRQKLQILVEHKSLEPKPVVFGVSVDTGPLTLFAKGAHVKGASEFLQRYSRAKYGEAVPIGFTVSELRARLGASQNRNLLIRTDNVG